jgi:hypothetical protein
MKSMRNCTKERQNSALSSLNAVGARLGERPLNTPVVSSSSMRSDTMYKDT